MFICLYVTYKHLHCSPIDFLYSFPSFFPQSSQILLLLLSPSLIFIFGQTTFPLLLLLFQPPPIHFTSSVPLIPLFHSHPPPPLPTGGFSSPLIFLFSSLHFFLSPCSFSSFLVSFPPLFLFSSSSPLLTFFLSFHLLYSSLISFNRLSFRFT